MSNTLDINSQVRKVSPTINGLKKKSWEAGPPTKDSLGGPRTVMTLPAGKEVSAEEPQAVQEKESRLDRTTSKS